MTGKARMSAYKDRVAETDQVKERKRARVEREAGDVPMEPRNKDDEQMAVRLRMHLAETSQKTQHDENRMRDIHVGKRGSRTASE